MTKSHFALQFSHLDLRIAMVPLMTPLASCDTDANTNGITWPKKAFCTLFQWCQLMMLLAAYDTHVSASGIKIPKSHVALHFICLNLQNAKVPLTALLASYDARTSTIGVTWPIMSCCISFWSSWHMEYYGTTDDAVHITWWWHQCSGITWEQHQCQWQHVLTVVMSMTSLDRRSNVLPYFNCLYLKNPVVPLMLLACCDTDASENNIK